MASLQILLREWALLGTAMIRWLACALEMGGAKSAEKRGHIVLSQRLRTGSFAVYAASVATAF